MSEGKNNLFAMFRRYKTYEIVDPDSDAKVSIGIRSLVTFEQDRLARELDRGRKVAREELDTVETRESTLVVVQGMTRLARIQRVLQFERPIALVNADLAPDMEEKGEKEETPAALPVDVIGDVGTGSVVEAPVELDPAAIDENGLTARDRKTLVRWERERREELDKVSDADLAELIVDRTVNMMVQSRAITIYTDHELAMTVVAASDVPAERKPLLSMDPEAPNYIGNLSREMKQKLMECRADFLGGPGGDRKTRDAVSDPTFLSNGASLNGQAVSPGETTVTSPISPGPSSASTTSVDGSTVSMKPSVDTAPVAAPVA